MAQYPLTDEEIIQWIDDKIKNHDDDIIGGMELVILSELKKRILDGL